MGQLAACHIGGPFRGVLSLAARPVAAKPSPALQPSFPAQLRRCKQLRLEIQMAAKSKDIDAALAAYDRAKRESIRLTPDSYSHLLFMCSLGEAGRQCPRAGGRGWGWGRGLLSRARPFRLHACFLSRACRGQEPR